MIDRKRTLLNLVNIDVPLNTSIEELKKIEWDSEDEIVIFHRYNVINVLQSYLNEELLCEEVFSWANAIEGRDDIGIEKEFEEKIGDAIFVLANPEISEELTRETALKIIDILSS
jgi:hypothetical protein